MSSTAVNYESHATVNWQCWEPVEGCLDPAADNYNCSVVQFTKCIGANMYADTVPRVSVHAPVVCAYATAAPLVPPPSPAHPPIAPGGAIATKYTTVVENLLDGDVSDFDAVRLAGLAKIICELVKLAPEACDSVAESASVKITTTITADTEGQSDAAATIIRTQMSSVADVTAILGIPALAAATVKQVQVYSIVNAPPSPPPGTDWAAIIGGSAGGLAGLFLIISVMWFMQRKSSKVEA
jgi:hypothetical protein